MKDIIVIHRNEPRVSSWLLKDGFQVEHRAIVRLINKYRSEFEEFGVIATELQKPLSRAGGRPVDAFLLNEEQALYLGTLLKNTDHVRLYKRVLVHEFSRMKKMLIQVKANQQNTEYLERRKAGKLIRREETDVIQRFVEYAESQGSQNAHRYYSNITTMENKSLFLIAQKYPNNRAIMDVQQLSVIGTADQIVARNLELGMADELNYKAIYQMAKKAITEFAKIIGRSPLPKVIEQGFKQGELF